MVLGDGTAAAAAGMDVVNGASTMANTIDFELNKGRDYQATLVQPIVRGGTGATTAAAARTALGIPTSAAQVGAAADGIGTGLVFTSPGFNRLSFAAPGVSGGAELALLYQLSNYVAKAGDTMTGDLYLPNSSPASSGWTNAYIDGSGRVCRGASALKYKKFVSAVDPMKQGNLFPQLVRYQMRNNPAIPDKVDGAWVLGHVADHMADDPDLDRFVVRIDGEVEAIHTEQLLLAQTAQLNARVVMLEQMVTQLISMVPTTEPLELEPPAGGQPTKEV